MSVTKNLRKEAAGHLAARRLAEAQAAYGELLARAPQDFEAHHRLGMLKVQTGAPQEGLRLLEAALALDPDHAEARLHHGMALQALGRPEEAMAEYRRAVALKPDFPEALFQLAMLARDLGLLEEALSCQERCALLAPHEPHVFLQRGQLRFLLNDFAGALEDFDLVLRMERDAAAAGRPSPALNPTDVLFNRALTLENLERDGEALAAYDYLLARAPGHADAWTNRGNLLRKAGRLEDAEASYRRAIALSPDHAAARLNRAVVRNLLGRNTEAMADFRHLLQIDPANRHALGGFLSAASALCDWDAVDALRPRLLTETLDGRALVLPFPMLLISSDPKFLHDVTLHRREALPPTGPRPALRPADGRIRLAYLSADFHSHATAHLMADLFARHDRRQFEVIGISFGRDSSGAMRERLQRGFERFIDVQAMSDAQVAALLRQMQADIAVDLKGYTMEARPGIFAHRAAPVQVSYLGYPGTMAADFMDYVLADPVVLPHAEQPFWDEKIVHLPDTYQVNDPARFHGAPMSRAEAGLPATGFVFASFNNNFKIDRPVFESWMRLLAAIPGSLLWLLDDGAKAQLCAHAQAGGIDPGRLIFAPKLEVETHMRRLPCADLMLDTLPYGAHTTASDALWMGVPIVTCRGTAFAGRVAASLLTAIDCPELITESRAAYEALALALARDDEKLAALKRKLAANRLATPLFDADRFRRHIEQAYVTMMDIARAGEAPRPFDVPVDI